MTAAAHVKAKPRIRIAPTYDEPSGDDEDYGREHGPGERIDERVQKRRLDGDSGAVGSRKVGLAGDEQCRRRG